MILDREDWLFAMLEPLHGAVVEVHVGDLELRRPGTPASSPRTAKPWFCDVMKDAPAREFLDRVIPTPMAVRHFHRLPAEREPKELMAEANAGHGTPAEAMPRIVSGA